MQTTLLCALCFLFAVVSAQQGGGQTRCPSPGSITDGGCRIGCILRPDRMSEQRCPSCNQTCNRMCQPVTCEIYCPNGFERDSRGCQICTCRQSNQQNCLRTVLDLLRMGCDRECVMRNDNDCPECEMACNRTNPMRMNREDCGRDQDCRRGICLSVGDAGIRRCQNLTDEGERCNPGEDDRERDMRGGDFDSPDDSDEARMLGRASQISGARDRFVVGTLTDVDADACGEDLRCSDQGMCMRVTGPCITRRQTNEQAECDEDGNFRPTQCRMMQNSRMMMQGNRMMETSRMYNCFCVHPNGTALTNSRNVTARSREDAPDCETMVFRPCRSMLSGRSYMVQHGDYAVRPAPMSGGRCQRCMCQDGRLERCMNTTRGDCMVVRPPTSGSQRNCMIRGRMVPHGNRTRIGRCNVCGCRNGNPFCTRVPSCENGTDPETNDTCQMCRSMPRRPVCGNDGQTYHSMCFAMHCGRLQSNETVPGPCSTLSTCDLYPCQRGMACLSRGGRTCLRQGGCSDDDQRICVNRTRLNCRNRDVDESVCGSNGQSYNSTCHLLQYTAGVQVAHARRCNDTECSGGMVCGTDRVTYNNICELRSRSGNARMEHMGRCQEGSDPDETPDQMCNRVRGSGNCTYNRTTCTHRVQPEVGCCPVCGGVVNIAMDSESLKDYAELDPSVDTLDEFSEKLVRNNLISRNASDRCNVHVSTTPSKNIEVAFRARNNSVARYCHDQGQELANRINRNMTRPGGMMGMMGNGDEDADLPPELDFAAAATTAPLVLDEIPTVGPTAGPTAGAPQLVSSIFLLLASMLFISLF